MKEGFVGSSFAQERKVTSCEGYELLNVCPRSDENGIHRNRAIDGRLDGRRIAGATLVHAPGARMAGG